MILKRTQFRMAADQIPIASMNFPGPRMESAVVPMRRCGGPFQDFSGIPQQFRFFWDNQTRHFAVSIGSKFIHSRKPMTNLESLFVKAIEFTDEKALDEFLRENCDNDKKLEKRVYVVPEKLDNQIAALKLKSMGNKLDSLTKEQVKYLASWDMGT